MHSAGLKRIQLCLSGTICAKRCREARRLDVLWHVVWQMARSVRLGALTVREKECRIKPGAAEQIKRRSMLSVSLPAETWGGMGR
jgi:hypothetical protein